VLHRTIVLLAILAVQGPALACTSHQAPAAAGDAQHVANLDTKPGETRGLEAPVPALALTGEAAETFLREAEVLDLGEYDNKGITHPRQATLTDGERTLIAVYKDVDEVYPKMTAGNGRILLNLKDHYKHEVAAYELDKLLGLGIVPPTVQRIIGREQGSLQLWINGAMTEWERKKIEKLSPPDMAVWNNQISTLKVFLQLTWDTDYSNISNIMVDESWNIWKIDSSRAFRIDAELRREDSLMRFSRSLLNSLEGLDRSEFEKVLSPWLNARQIKTLWQRRTRILELAGERVAEFGEESVLYD